MPRHRTTARGILFLLVIAGLTAGGAAASTSTGTGAAAVPRLIFPVVGPARYTDDFGQARGQSGHQGNDILAPKRAVAVAVEAGTVKYHTTSSRAGCMLYLYGASGTTYLYIHLNNDLTSGNDNTGKCVAGVAFAKHLKNGAKVAAGEPVGFVGDSGDANGGSPHLHFEVHPRGGGAVSPFTHLRNARKLLLAVRPGNVFTAALRGKIVATYADSLTLDVERAQSWPGGLRVADVRRKIELTMPPETRVFNPLGALVTAAKLAALKRGQAAVAWTQAAMATLPAALGSPRTLRTDKVVLATTTTATGAEPASGSGYRPR